MYIMLLQVIYGRTLVDTSGKYPGTYLKSEVSDPGTHLSYTHLILKLINKNASSVPKQFSTMK